MSGGAAAAVQIQTAANENKSKRGGNPEESARRCREREIAPVRETVHLELRLEPSTVERVEKSLERGKEDQEKAAGRRKNARQDASQKANQIHGGTRPKDGLQSLDICCCT